MHTNKDKPVSREEEYRDYEERDLKDGWPYADGDGATAAPSENRAYGETSADFDLDRNPGYRTEDVEADGSEPALAQNLTPDTIGVEEADDLEERVTDNISNLDGIELNAIDVHVEGRTVILEGDVDTVLEKRRVELAALSVDGVRRAENRLNTLGVDSHIPSDADE